MVAFLSEETLERLNFDIWLKFFEKEIRLSDNPFFEKWYREKYSEIDKFEADVTVNPDAKWQRITAILSIAYGHFTSLALPVPESWRERHHQDTFTLPDIRNNTLPHFEVHSWIQQFDNYEEGLNDWLDEGNEREMWWFRKKLLDEFRNLYFSEIKTLLGKNGIKRNKALRDLVVEASFYSKSSALSNEFYKNAGTFLEQIKPDKSDPMIDFAKTVLTAVFIGEEKDIDRKAIVMKMLDGYWIELKTSKKPADLVDLISTEIRELVDFLVLEMER